MFICDKITCNIWWLAVVDHIIWQRQLLGPGTSHPTPNAPNLTPEGSGTGLGGDSMPLWLPVIRHSWQSPYPTLTPRGNRDSTRNRLVARGNIYVVGHLGWQAYWIRDQFDSIYSNKRINKCCWFRVDTGMNNHDTIDWSYFWRRKVFSTCVGGRIWIVYQQSIQPCLR